jgi:hypothetical protein
MAQLDLLKFINTHPSPGTNNNVNFWITTGSQGEFFLNGVTVPLEAQETELATIISQADKLYFSEIPGVYQFTVSNPASFPLQSESPSGICGISFSGDSNEEITLFGTREKFHENYRFTSFNLFGGTGDPYNGDDKWFKASGSADLGYSVQIDSNGFVTAYVSCSLSTEQLNPFQEEGTVKCDISKKEKVVSGSLYHYYLLFEKPIPLQNVSPLGQQSINFFNIYFEPSFNSVFAYNDYEVLGNDVQEIRKSNKFLKVDRNFSQLNPTNFEVIIGSSGSKDAEIFAEVQDSYYDSISWIKSRYEGSSYQSPSRLPAAHYSVPIDVYIFETQVSSSALLQDIKNGVQQFPPISPIYFYTPTEILTKENFSLTVSGSRVSTSATEVIDKITITRVNSTGNPVNVTADETVTLSFFGTNNWGTFSNIERTLTIPNGLASGSLNYSSYRKTTSIYWISLTTEETLTFSGIKSTSIPDTSIPQSSLEKSTPDGRVVGATLFLVDRETRADFLPLAGKKFYDPKTKTLYETDSQGLLIDTLV